MVKRGGVAHVLGLLLEQALRYEARSDTAEVVDQPRARLATGRLAAGRALRKRRRRIAPLGRALSRRGNLRPMPKGQA
jgi:hypothetical protein